MIDLSNENIIHVKKNNIEYIQFRKLLEYKDKISHCYTVKSYDIDYKENDGKNYKLLCESLSLDYNKLIRIENQIHSNFVENIEENKEVYTNIDGLISNKKDTSLLLRYADCTAIFLYDKNKNVIANIHSGWKGTSLKIIKVAIEKMIKDYKSNPEDIICCFGPNIAKCCFKVDEDVKNIFKETFSYMNNKDIIKVGKIEEGKQKYYIDTNLINRMLAIEAGVKDENIIESKICTVCNHDKFYSYRKDKTFKRNAGIIGFVK